MANDHDLATVTTTVAVDPKTAFAIFTDDIDLWWKRGPRYRFDGRGTPPAGSAAESRRGSIDATTGDGTLQFADRQLVERAADGRVFVVGAVTRWEPGARLAFDWRARNFAADEITHVDVAFEPVAAGTRVTIAHRGWAALRADHPVRHGATGGAFIAQTGLWWGELAVAFRAFTAGQARPAR